MTESANRRPLEGLRVLDLTVALAGPYGTLLLAGLGAEVIKIEAPGGGDIARFNPPFYGEDGMHFDALAEGDISLSILARARQKKSVSLDLKSQEGRELFYALAEHADIVFENLSDGATERLGGGLRDGPGGQPEDRLLLGDRTGQAQPPSGCEGHGHHGPGAQRTDGHHRLRRRPAGAGGHRDLRPARTAVRGDRRPGGVAAA